MSLYPLLRLALLPVSKSALQSVTGQANIPATGGFIIAANHVDWLDGFFIAAAVEQACCRPVKFLTSSNNYWWTGVAVQIPEKKSEIVDHAVKELRVGHIICNFPEGQRNPESTMLPGHTGTVRMAALAGVPVIPVGIIAVSKPSMRDSIRRLRQPDQAVAINFGSPMFFSSPAGGLTGEWLKAETSRLMSAIAPLAGKRVV
jgi:1-acyl-sn-glycerol-3-phosphate acyltransferase